MTPIRLDRTPITRAHRIAVAIGAAVAALLIGVVVTKDTGLIHGTTSPAVLYCTKLADEFGADGVGGGQDGCVEMFEDLDPADQKLLLEDLGR